jgi:hypothetical protein
LARTATSRSCSGVSAASRPALAEKDAALAEKDLDLEAQRVALAHSSAHEGKLGRLRAQLEEAAEAIAIRDAALAETESAIGQGPGHMPPR